MRPPAGTTGRLKPSGEGQIELPEEPLVRHLPSRVCKARSGSPFLRSIQIALRPNRAGSVLVDLDRPGDVRLHTFQAVDLRVDKTFTIQRAKVQAILDVFNLTNASTVLSRRRVQNANNANQTSSILAPRVLRFGVRVTF